MSDDLISRSALLEELKDFRMTITGSANAMALVVVDETKKSIMRIIDKQPTAYDVDKVIDVLNGAIECCRREHDDSGVWRFEQAIEIVKSGGIADD